MDVRELVNHQYELYPMRSQNFNPIYNLVKNNKLFKDEVLVRLLKNGDQNSFEKVRSNCLLLVVLAVNKYAKNNKKLNIAVDMALTGLTDACKNYDFNSNINFTTFVMFTITNYIFEVIYFKYISN